MKKHATPTISNENDKEATPTEAEADKSFETQGKQNVDPAADIDSEDYDEDDFDDDEPDRSMRTPTQPYPTDNTKEEDTIEKKELLKIES